MELGMVGLGRMGGNMVRRLLEGGHRVAVSRSRQSDSFANRVLAALRREFGGRATRER